MQEKYLVIIVNTEFHSVKVVKEYNNCAEAKAFADGYNEHSDMYSSDDDYFADFIKV